MIVEQSKGEKIYDFAAKIFPYCRSITGAGVRQTLADIKEYIERDTDVTLAIYSVPSGTQVFDWTVPREWEIQKNMIAGFNISCVGYSRSKYGEYPEYHTSKDDRGLVSPAGFQGSYDVMTALIELLEHNGYYRMTVLGEPQLGKRGLYPTISRKGSASDVRVMMNFITYADGTIILPTYNWDFCKGKTFDYCKTPGMTGSLGKAALKRSDFKSTKHPIYSFFTTSWE